MGATAYVTEWARRLARCMYGNLASTGANKGTKRKLTAAETATPLEASSDSDFDDTEFYDSDDAQYFKCMQFVILNVLNEIASFL